MNHITRLYNYLRFFAASAYCSVCTRIFELCSIRQNRILFFNFNGKGYGDSEKYIVDEILKNKKPVEIFWSAKPRFRDTLPDGVKYVRHYSIKMFYITATAHIWINNMRFHEGFHKKKNQFYLQLWHSSLRLKKIEADAGQNALGRTYVKTAKKDSKMINLITSGSRFSTHTYQRAFWYDGEILECGTPRADIFFNQERKTAIRKKICQKYHINEKQKIVLYAPTFRKNSNEGKSYVDNSALNAMLGNRYTLLVRSHPISKYNLSAPGVVNVTDYPDMQELICAADFLITDYSGCCFDALINGTPCILHTPDLKEYLSRERNLYFSFDELPFPQTKTEATLTETIKNFNLKDYKKQCAIFANRVGLCEKGTASKTIADIIVNKCIGEK